MRADRSSWWFPPASATRSYSDVLVGEVWLCSGQSNMDFTLAKTEKRSFSGATNWEKEVAAANHPQLRMFTAEWAMNEFPQRDVPGILDGLLAANGGRIFPRSPTISAASIQQDLKVPVGLGHLRLRREHHRGVDPRGDVGGASAVQGLLDAFGKKRLAFRDDPKHFLDYGNALAKCEKRQAPEKSRSRPGPAQSLRAAQRHDRPHRPLRHPRGDLVSGRVEHEHPPALSGSPADAHRRLARPLGKSRSCRSISSNSPLTKPRRRNPPAAASSPRCAGSRRSHSPFPHTGMAVTLDIGDEKDVHPRNKLDVGKRLARLALAGTYGKPGERQRPAFRESSDPERPHVHPASITPAAALSPRTEPCSSLPSPATTANSSGPTP